MDYLLFVGTGVSTAIPILSHIHRTPAPCAVCDDAVNIYSRNRRNNVSLLIHVDSTNSNIIIDVGKTFRAAFLKVLQPRKIIHFDAMLLTHDHADAILGIDDLRDLQNFDTLPNGAFRCRDPLPTYLTQKTLQVLREIMPYITEPSLDQKTDELEHPVTCLAFRMVPETPHVETVCGLAVTMFPMYHGGTYISLGYLFGEKTRVAYLSDVSALPDISLQLLKSKPLDYLIVDCLEKPGEKHFSHFGVDDVWRLVMELKPKRLYCVGMYCVLDHDFLNTYLEGLLRANREELPDTEIVAAAFDGLELQMHF